MIQQYPVFIWYASALIGLGLAVFRPKIAFLFVAFGLAAQNANAAVLTRAFLGPYVNLQDVFILTAVTAMCIYWIRERRKVNFPPIFLLIIAAWTIGTFVSIWRFGTDYEVLREARWALTFPIMLLVGANLVTDKRDVRNFLIALSLGGCVAAIQHFIWIGSAIRLDLNFRTIGFLDSSITYLLAAFLLVPITKHHGLNWLLPVLVGIFGFSTLMHQTRSVWIAIAVTLIVVAFILRRRDVVSRIIILIVLAVVVSFLLTNILTPQLNPINVFLQRYSSLTDARERYETTVTRQHAIEQELKEWYEGNWLLGNGFAFQYYTTIRAQQFKDIAWGHVGYVSYLARLGIFGFIIYGIAIWVFALRTSLRLLKTYKTGELHWLAILGMCTVLVCAIGFAMSSSYFEVQKGIPGLIFGVTFGIEATLMSPQSERENERKNAAHNRRHAVIQPGSLHTRNNRIRSQSRLS